MQNLEKFLHRKHIADIRAEGDQREIAEGVFKEWRDQYVSSLCRWMRLHFECWNRSNVWPDVIVINPGPPSPAWCNAAVSLLTAAPEDVQDTFLRALPADKDRMVQAVLDDGGVTALNGFFQELPPL